MTLIVDASVAVKWVVNEFKSSEARQLLVNRIQEPLIAPDLLLLECVHALHKKVRNSEFDYEDIRFVLPVFTSGISQFVPITNVVNHAVDLSVSLHHSVYDCIYLATALFTQCKLITADQQFVENLADTVYINHVKVL